MIWTMRKNRAPPCSTVKKNKLSCIYLPLNQRSEYLEQCLGNLSSEMPEMNIQ